MGFFRVKAGQESTIIVNRDCCARVMLDYLKVRLGITDADIELDLCDEWGNIRLLSQAPPRCSALHLIATRALYTPVAITQAPSLKFEFPMGKPVSTQKLRDAQRKVRRQLVKFQKLCSTASSQFISNEEAVEMIYQVVGSPSGEYGKGKGKSRDPAPKSPRQRTASMVKKKKASIATDQSESKENAFGNDKQPSQKSGTAIKDKNVSFESEQDGTAGAEADKRINEPRKQLKDAEVNGNDDANQDDDDVGDMPEGSADLKEAQTYEGKSPDTLTNKSDKLIEGREHLQASKVAVDEARSTGNKQSGKGANKTAPERASSAGGEQTVNPADGESKVPESTVSAEAKGEKAVPVERPVTESADSGIESAASRSGDRAKDRAMRDTSSDAQSASGEAGSNEDSTGETASSQSKVRLRHRRSSKMPAIPEQDTLASTGAALDAAPAKSTAFDVDEQSQSDYASGSIPSDASNIGGEKNITRPSSNTATAGASNPATGTPAAPGPTGESSSPSAASQQHPPPSADSPGAIPDDIAGLTVSIVPPSLAAPHRRSVDVTALLGLPLADGAAGAEAEASTGRGVPSMIDQEWRRVKPSAEHLLGVLSATSKLVYLGSARSRPVPAPQIDVISATEEEAQRIGAGAGTMLATGAAEALPAGSEEQEEEAASQPDTWRSPPGSVVET